MPHLLTTSFPFPAKNDISDVSGSFMLQPGFLPTEAICALWVAEILPFLIFPVKLRRGFSIIIIGRRKRIADPVGPSGFVPTTDGNLFKTNSTLGKEPKTRPSCFFRSTSERCVYYARRAGRSGLPEQRATLLLTQIRFKAELASHLIYFRPF